MLRRQLSLVLILESLWSAGAYAQSSDEYRGPHFTESVRVFRLVSSTAGVGKTQCSATLLKLENTCHLLTNAHCVRTEDMKAYDEVDLSASPRPENDHASSLARDPEFTYFTATNFTEKVSVVKRDDLLDLAELSIPSTLRDTCLELLSTPITWPEHFVFTHAVQNLASVGYVRGHRQVDASMDIPWHQGYGVSTLTMYPTAKEPDALLLQATQLRVIPGMSGGVTVNSWGEVVGLTTRFIPMQYNGFITPLQTVVHFLKKADVNHVALIAPRSEVASLISNRANYAGANSHGNGGGNSHGNGGDRDDRFSKADPLDILAEPDEGYPLTQNSGAPLLLGVNSQQIDGFDDFSRRYLGAGGEKLSSGKLVTRESGGYPEATVRRDLLKRLDGYYEWMGEQRDNRHLLYIESPHTPEGWELTMFGGDVIYLDINAKASKIIVHLFSHPLQSVANSLLSIQLKEETLEYNVTFESDSKRIVLKSPFGNLQCDNRNFLKLNCAGDGVRLSFSYEGSESKAMHYRFSRTLQINGANYISYQFGNLVSAPNPERRRKAF